MADQPVNQIPRLELRVHGVSGTPPEDLLDRPLVDQIAGDSIAGFYQPRLDDERYDDRPTPHSKRVDGIAPKLVGYCWGGLTSGSAGRALWLLLLPFTLVNIAPRARPNGGEWAKWPIWTLCRLIALTVTGLFVLTGTGVGIDLMGWQCAHSHACASASPSSVFRHVFRQHEFSDEHMLILGALIPLLFIFVLWFVSGRTLNRYERVVSGGPTTERDDEIEVGLDSAWMWRNEDQVRRLRATHIQAGLALVLWAATAPTEPDGADPAPHMRSYLAVAVLVWSVFCLMWSKWVGHGRWLSRSTGKDDRGHDKLRIASFVAWAILAAGWLQLAIGLTFLHGWIHPEWISGRSLEERGLPRFAETVLWTFYGGVAALLVLVVVVVFAAMGNLTSRAPNGDRHKQQRAGLLGMGTAILAAFGVFLGAALTAGIYTYAAGWLTTGSVKPGFSELGDVYSRLAVPDAVRAASQAFLVSTAALLLIAIFAGAVFVVGLARTRELERGGILFLVGAVAIVVLILDRITQVVDLRAWLITALAILGIGSLAVATGSWSAGVLVNDGAIKRDYGVARPERGNSRRSRWRSIWRAIYLARLVDCAPWVLGPLAVVGFALVIMFAWPLHTINAAKRHGTGFMDHIHWLQHKLEAVHLTSSAIGAYLTVMFLLGLVGLGTITYRTPALRRSVGILWDVASFWPRASHPLAAPCYAERTVPDLVTFVRAESATNTVVLAAHSQGTVISAAVIRQLRSLDGAPDGAIMSKVGFLSFGCVLRRLYGRYFPVYFGPAELDELQDCLTRPGMSEPRWRNLWRWTDYLGGWVTHTMKPGMTEPGPDWERHEPDPSRFTHSRRDLSYPRPHRHSDYWKDESGYFQQAAADLADMLPTYAPSKPAP